jgi:hypothetical protein
LTLGGRLGIRPAVLIAGIYARGSAYEKLACYRKYQRPHNLYRQVIVWERVWIRLAVLTFIVTRSSHVFVTKMIISLRPVSVRPERDCTS